MPDPKTGAACVVKCWEVSNMANRRKHGREKASIAFEKTHKLYKAMPKKMRKNERVKFIADLLKYSKYTISNWLNFYSYEEYTAKQVKYYLENMRRSQQKKVETKQDDTLNMEGYNGIMAKLKAIEYNQEEMLSRLQKLLEQ